MILCILQGVRNIAAISLNIGYPTACSAPHSIINGFKRLLAVAVETDIDFEEANQVTSIIAVESFTLQLCLIVLVCTRVLLKKKIQAGFADTC